MKIKRKSKLEDRDKQTKGYDKSRSSKGYDNTVRTNRPRGNRRTWLKGR